MTIDEQLQSLVVGFRLVLLLHIFDLGDAHQNLPELIPAQLLLSFDAMIRLAGGNNHPVNIRQKQNVILDLHLLHQIRKLNLSDRRIVLLL